MTFIALTFLLAGVFLTAAGAALGSSVLPAGLSVLGTALSGAAIGTQIGALAGSVVDQALFGASGAVPSTIPIVPPS